jgi:hypothetical protein
LGEMEDIVDLVTLSDDELRHTIHELEAEEQELSRQRRLLHGKLDILRAELVLRLRRDHDEGTSLMSGHDVALLARVLAGKGVVEPDAATEGEEPDGPGER